MYSDGPFDARYVHVFDYSLEDIAELTGSTVGAVKAALNRARTKLAESSPAAKPARSVSPELQRIMQLYVVGSTAATGTAYAN